jgi:hypothetical protein
VETVTTTQVFDFELSRSEREAIRALLVALAPELKGKIAVLKSARVKVQIQVKTKGKDALDPARSPSNTGNQ